MKAIKGKKAQDQALHSDSLRRLGNSRRAFLKQGSLFLASTAAAGSFLLERCEAANDEQEYQVRFGLLTDCHYADKDPAGTRFYRDSIAKIKEAVAEFDRSRATFAVELGDLVDAADDVETEIGYLRTIEREFAKFKGDRHYVFGNHCLHTLTKKEFIDNSAAKKPHYSFDAKGFHFIVLDACYRHDGVAYERRNFDWTDANIPAEEVKWLAADLEATDKKTVVFVHQRLDITESHSIKNAEEVRRVLEESGKVSAVFQGHSHQNEYVEIGGIHYCTQRAVVEKSGVENSGYALVDLYEDGSLRVEGFRLQDDYDRLAAG